MIECGGFSDNDFFLPQHQADISCAGVRVATRVRASCGWALARSNTLSHRNEGTACCIGSHEGLVFQRFLADAAASGAAAPTVCKKFHSKQLHDDVSSASP